MIRKKLRCANCGRVLMYLEYGKLEIKCPRCGHVMEYERDKVMSSEGACRQPGQPTLKK